MTTVTPGRFLRRLASALTTAGLAVAGCSGGSPDGDAPTAIVLISIDTLRSDRLPVYGYEGVETPAIDALRRDGVLFERAYSHTPMTLPAHASMLTGLLPPEHGVRGNSGYRLAVDQLPFLPQLLKKRGYATGAAVSSFVMRRETGMAAGFDFYEDGTGPEIDREVEIGSAVPDSPEDRQAWRLAARETNFQRSGEDTLKAALPWLRAQSRAPFFFLLHLYEPHSPHNAPEPYASRYADPYDAEIATVDRVVADLMQELEQMGRYTDALVILTSDHGEGLGDHGEDGHGIFLYRESLQVPLILKLPENRWAGRSVGAPVQLVDLVPTILDQVGESSGRDLPGTSLVRLVEEPESNRQIYAETYFPRFFFGWSELVSLIEGSWQYIESPEPELYDLANDVAQQHNLVADERPAFQRLRRDLASYDRKLVNPRDTDVETWQKLASLGYVGHGQLRVDRPLPAPHSQLHVLESMEEGFRQALDGQDEAAVRTLRQVVAENPFAVVAWEQLGRSLERLGRLADAQEAYLEALALTDGAPHLMLIVARSSAQLGDLERARALATEARPWDEAGATQILGRVALATGDLDEAERYLRASLAASPGSPDVLFMLAQVQLQRGLFTEALLTTEKIEEITDLRYPKLHLLRGNILASAGRMEEAERTLRREIELFPTGTLAYRRLALFLANQGRPEGAVDVVRELVERNPGDSGYAAAVRILQALGDPRSARALLVEASRRFPESSELAALREAAEK